MNNNHKNGIGFSLLALVGVLAIAKVIHSIYKKESENKDPILISDNSEEDETEIITSKETAKEQPKKLPKELGKNSWLYPTDEFGIMEKGKVS